MSIEKMVLLKIVSSTEEMTPIIKELILNENVHLNLNIENSQAYTNYYVLHQYESDILGSKFSNTSAPYFDESEISDKLDSVKELAKGLGAELILDKSILSENFDINYAHKQLENIETSIGARVREINSKKQMINELIAFREIIDSIEDKNLELNKIDDLNYFEYEVGTLSNANRLRIKKNYENLSAIVIRIGTIKSLGENLYMIIYPKQYKGEADNLLKSLNWNAVKTPEGIKGNPVEMISMVDERIKEYNQDINNLSVSIDSEKELNIKELNRLYNILNLEEKINLVKKKADFEDNIFAVNVWVQASEINNLKNSIAKVSDKYILTEKTAEEMGSQVTPPTKLKNNWFAKPFETIVRLYGLPSYNELDPTPFLAITFWLAFGVMFGDIGQGLVYFLAGLALLKKIPVAGQILTRLGSSSIVFGFVYGSFFGLEKAELPWLPGLLEGGPLRPDNIPMILFVGIIYGVIVLTISYAYGIINSIRNKDIEAGIFGKNSIVGYAFFISFIFTLVAITGITNLPISIPVTILLISLIIMILKEPLTNLVTKQRPLFHHGASAYFTEAIFEAIETILSTLSNSISFVRVGAFALNHAGLFLAFLVMSEMFENVILKILILVVGNVLILSLEGLIVFIQGLRLQYYEMFSKYFKGDGIEFNPLKLKN